MSLGKVMSPTLHPSMAKPPFSTNRAIIATSNIFKDLKSSVSAVSLANYRLNLEERVNHEP